MARVRPMIDCDMGEGFGLYQFGEDEGVIPFVTMINVACGFHASDPMVMRRAALAKDTRSVSALIRRIRTFKASGAAR